MYRRNLAQLFVVFAGLGLTACNGEHRDAAANAAPAPAPPSALPASPAITTFTGSPASVASGGVSTLTWSSSNATGCTASGGWSGAKATAGSQATGALASTTTYTLACTGSGGTAQSAVTVTVTTAPAPPPPAPGGMDFQTRCAQSGVIKCVGFDSAADFSRGSGGTNGAFGFSSGIMPPYGTADYTRAVQDTVVKASGTGSLRFTIPSNSGSDSSGAYFANFADDLSIQFEGNQEFFIQWRQRFSREMLTTRFQGGGGFKQIIVGTGDKPGKVYSSCTALEVVMFNYEQAGFPAMYNSCTGSATHGPYDGFYQPYNAYDYKLQNGRPAPYCLYTQGTERGGAYFPPGGNCFGYFADEWMTFQLQFKLGARVGDEFKGSQVRMWMAREGQPSELVIDWGPYNLTAGPAAELQRFGKVWLLPYNTGKSAAQAHPDAYTWYDELIISRNRISDP